MSDPDSSLPGLNQNQAEDTKLYMYLHLQCKLLIDISTEVRNTKLFFNQYLSTQGHLYLESVPRYANQIYFCYHVTAELIIENINSLLHAGVLGILTITLHLS